MSRLKMLILATMAVAAILAVGASSALAGEFGCGNCAKVSGPNENPIDKVISRNESGTGVCALIWKFNGGSNYNREGKVCTGTGSETSVHTEGFKHINGHGETERLFTEFTYKLSGFQFTE